MPRSVPGWRAEWEALTRLSGAFQEVGEACALKASAQIPEWLYLYAAARTISCPNRGARERCLPSGFPSRQGAVLREAAGGAVAAAI